MPSRANESYRSAEISKGVTRRRSWIYWCALVMRTTCSRTPRGGASVRRVLVVAVAVDGPRRTGPAQGKNVVEQAKAV